MSGGADFPSSNSNSNNNVVVEEPKTEVEYEVELGQTFDTTGVESNRSYHTLHCKKN